MTLPISGKKKAAAGVAIRGGCFCNPGAAERAFASKLDIASCLDIWGEVQHSCLQARLDVRRSGP